MDEDMEDYGFEYSEDEEEEEDVDIENQVRFEPEGRRATRERSKAAFEEGNGAQAGPQADRS
eukprot:scaffold287_cov337-Pavlova_lutheri.AAC.226